MLADTIAAVSTPPGQGALAVIRVSGPDARAVIGKIWRGPAVRTPRRACVGRIVDENGQPVDQVVLTWFRAPASYTGECLVEISCHGGVLVARRILELLTGAGARVAGPGEFTQRAFLNGKMDLTQAEAVMDLISAQSALSLRAAGEQLAGRLGDRMRQLREHLIASLAQVEAQLDFPEEDIDPETGHALRERVSAIRAEVESLLSTAKHGHILRHGARVVITGAPNVGKSSLLNALLGFERAIVNESPGTTRDTIEEMMDLCGLPVRLVDTAGLRESADPLEREGMSRTRRALEAADLVIELADASRPREAFQSSGAPATQSVLVLNKIDLGEDPSWDSAGVVRLSCRTGAGLDALADQLFSRLTGGDAGPGADLIAINARHHSSLDRARQSLDAALELSAHDGPPELVAEELRAALEAIGDVVGRTDSEELLGVIFSRFCIGK